MSTIQALETLFHIHKDWFQWASLKKESEWDKPEAGWTSLEYFQYSNQTKKYGEREREREREREIHTILMQQFGTNA